MGVVVSQSALHKVRSENLLKPDPVYNGGSSNTKWTVYSEN